MLNVLQVVNSRSKGKSALAVRLSNQDIQV